MSFPRSHASAQQNRTQVLPLSRCGGLPPNTVLPSSYMLFLSPMSSLTLCHLHPFLAVAKVLLEFWSQIIHHFVRLAFLKPSKQKLLPSASLYHLYILHMEINHGLSAQSHQLVIKQCKCKQFQGIFYSHQTGKAKQIWKHKLVKWIGCSWWKDNQVQCWSVSHIEVEVHSHRVYPEQAVREACKVMHMHLKH